MSNKFKKTTFIFNDVNASCVGAIEYVIYMYGKEEWFNAALYKVVTDTFHAKTKNDICYIPFIMTKKEYLKSKEILFEFNDYHYIICQIEKYFRKYNSSADDQIYSVENCNQLQRYTHDLLLRVIH